MKTVEIGFEALRIVPILSRYLSGAAQTPQKLARPARIELAAPRLGVLPKEATRGSGTLLPHNSIGVPANPPLLETTPSRYRRSLFRHSRT